jgi:uncharacterized protein (TIGR02266 family)
MEQSDRRRAPRIPRLVEVRYQSDSPPMTARLTDISERGIFVDTPNPLPVGSPVTLSFLLTNTPGEKPIAMEGNVAWRQETVGMGIEFVQLKEEDRAKIKRFIASQE